MKPEDLTSKLTACGALAGANPAAMHHQQCIMQKLNGASEDNVQQDLASCDHYMYASMGGLYHPSLAAAGIPMVRYRDI